jgi:hypothetical protein
MLMGEAAETQDPAKLKAASNTRPEEHFIIVLKMLCISAFSSSRAVLRGHVGASCVPGMLFSLRWLDLKTT